MQTMRLGNAEMLKINQKDPFTLVFTMLEGKYYLANVCTLLGTYTARTVHSLRPIAIKNDLILLVGTKDSLQLEKGSLQLEKDSLLAEKIHWIKIKL